MWIAFHLKLRVSELPKIWSSFLSTIKVEVKDKLFEQSVNQKLYEKLLCQHLSAIKPTVVPTPNPNPVQEMSVDELNALQYAAGYVPHALLKRYESQKQRKHEFIECLGDMAVHTVADEGDRSDRDFFDYTKRWIDKVNRGGLFPLNNITHQFFVKIEQLVQVVLPSHCIKSSSTDVFKQEVVKKIAEDEDIQWHWTLISQCIDSEEDAVELLHEIVLLWVTVRGFSLAATWLETYKKSAKKSTEKKVSLRKNLKRSLNDAKEDK